MKEHQPFLENLGHFILWIEFLLAVLSDFEKEVALENPFLMGEMLDLCTI